MMITTLLKTKRAPRGVQPHNSISGPAFLPVGAQWPQCSCGAQMVLFLQFDIAEEFGLPFAVGSHFTLFMCPVHNDAPDDFDKPRLPRNFWKKRPGLTEDERFYELLLHPPGATAAVTPDTSYLVHKELQFTRKREVTEVLDAEPREIKAHPQFEGLSLSVAEAVGWHGLKIGGQPHWVQEPVVHRCACGSEMHFLCQIPDEYEFAKLPAAPEQDNCYADEYYNLFIGNYAYVFACEAQCHPQAVHVVVQN